MSINLENYESYLLDYLEDTLSKEERIQVELFLSAHPGIAKECEELIESRLTEFNSDTPDFNHLKKQVVWDEEEVTGLLINEMEAELEPFDLDRLKQFKKGFPKLYAELSKLVNASKVHPKDFSLELSFKESLLKLDEDSIEFKAIAFTEGDLDLENFEEAKKELETNQEFKTEVNLYSNLKLSPDVNELPPSFINSLKQKEQTRIVPLWVQRFSAVAAVLLIAVLIPFGKTEPTAKYAPRLSSENVALQVGQEPYQFGGLKSAVLPMNEDMDSIQLTKFDADVFLKAYEEPSSNQIFLGKSKNREEFAHSVEHSRTFLPSSSSKTEVSFMTFKNNGLKLNSIATQPLGAEFLSVEDIDWEDSYDNNEEDVLNLEDFAQAELKERLGLDSEEPMALALANNGAKKLLGVEEDVMTYQKKEEKKGFKFALGKFSIETIR